jgi:hypothetical protein
MSSVINILSCLDSADSILMKELAYKEQVVINQRDRRDKVRSHYVDWCKSLRLAPASQEFYEEFNFPSKR